VESWDEMVLAKRNNFHAIFRTYLMALTREPFFHMKYHEAP
jgi:hypothetical protein